MVAPAGRVVLVDQEAPAVRLAQLRAQARKMAARPMPAADLAAGAEAVAAAVRRAQMAPRARELERGPAPGPVVLDPAAIRPMPPAKGLLPR